MLVPGTQSLSTSRIHRIDSGRKSILCLNWARNAGITSSAEEILQNRRGRPGGALFRTKSWLCAAVLNERADDSVGLPGREKSICTPARYAHRSLALAVCAFFAPTCPGGSGFADAAFEV